MCGKTLLLSLPQYAPKHPPNSLLLSLFVSIIFWQQRGFRAGAVANTFRRVCRVIWKMKSQSQVGYLFALPKYLTNRQVRKEITKKTKQNKTKLCWTGWQTHINMFSEHLNMIYEHTSRDKISYLSFTQEPLIEKMCVASGLKPPLLTNSHYIS